MKIKKSEDLWVSQTRRKVWIKLNDIIPLKSISQAIANVRQEFLPIVQIYFKWIVLGFVDDLIWTVVLFVNLGLNVGAVPRMGQLPFLGFSSLIIIFLL